VAVNAVPQEPDHLVVMSTPIQNQTVQFDGTGTFTTELGTSFSASVSFAPAPSSALARTARTGAAQTARTLTYTIPSPPRTSA
jgi:hypothetical protein